ncbi:FxsB family cyclophane-forming radical SAM/SPASM peptide maturase [Kitasatospora mediocidica]|uniref:FxsB family cyclophane-forming radical SAM/SPASM peptide maturase n=1 Tax=Kitasatospora mediocidica TaxID=58352 RepID=UPI00055C4042|nr:FxsB family cyclophane-forming radical SAM/SPASM peptide maturase [Kitasatospora mediocidica]
MTLYPVPFSQFVLKVHSRCDLACDHCYVYEHADTSWRGRPRAVAAEVLDRTAERIAEHAARHRLRTVHVVLHGGEPLLAGPVLLRRAAESLRAALPSGCALDLRIHTNGVQLDQAFCELFDELGIRVGVSLDGGAAANDRHRRYADGRSSYSQVIAAVGLLRRPEFRHLYAGLLCTIDVENDPVEVYDALVELEPPRIDFLLPHGTWENPPARPTGAGPHPYADWLLAVYDRWEAQGRPVPVRTFDSVHRTLRGKSSLTESLGLDPSDLVVIETDGTFEQADSLKTAYDGAAGTGFDVFAHSLDQVAEHPGMMKRQSGLAGLSETCQACPVVRSCGGGLYAHRWRAETEFDNPSVFCPDLLALITAIRDRTDRTPVLPAQAAAPEGLRPPVLTERQLDQLAHGHGDGATVRALAGAQLGLSRGLLAAVADRAGAAAPAGAWELLTALDAEAPQAVDTVLAHPYVRAWASRCLVGEAGADPGGLAEIAAAAALRAGTPGSLRVPIRDGAVHLPTLGRVITGGSGRALVEFRQADGQVDERAGGRVRFSVWTPDGTAVHVAPDGVGEERWQPLRRVRVLDDWTVALEDVDPQRDSHLRPVEQRISAAALADWTGALREAWELLGRDMPDYAVGIGAGLGTITPLVPGPAGREVSAAARQAFGAVAIARPATSPILAMLLAHEFQHVKLGAVLDLYDLYDPADAGRYYAPWRSDPRPLEALLQGTYAHLAVTEFWGTRVAAYDGVSGEAAERARSSLAVSRAHTDRAIDSLLDSGALTDLGQRFTTGMRATVAPWLDVPVGHEAQAQARRAAASVAEWQGGRIAPAAAGS